MLNQVIIYSFIILILQLHKDDIKLTHSAEER